MGRRNSARRNGGLARVSAVWLVTIVVLLLGALAFAFMAQSDVSAEHTARLAAEEKEKAASAARDQALQESRNVSAVLGWFADSSDARSDVEKAKKGLEDLKGTFTDLGPAETSFEGSLEKIVAAFNDRGRKIGELEARIQTLEAEVQTANDSTSTVETQKNEEINRLRQQVADEQKNAQSRQQELEGRMEALRTQLTERDTELKTAGEQHVLAQRALQDEKRVLEARNSALSKTTKFTKAPYADVPDGRIIEVSDWLKLGWIDIGANQRVNRGLRFRVESGTPSERHLKAWADVTQVEGDRAEVVFSGHVDRFDPVVAGDVIVNPLFDPEGERYAVLVGRFSSTYTEPELKTLLERMGILVQPAIDVRTDFLIVGSELFNDPDTNEPLEEPIQPEDLPEYKTAESRGDIQIVPLRDISEFFRAAGV